MKTRCWISLFILMNHPLFSEHRALPPAQEIADQANLPLLNPSLSLRKTAKIRLANGLDVLLISDPEADQSAASLAVQTGSWDDPSDYPGMAHFCEHMLFMGSKKFPNENEFSSLIADHNGKTNAFTAPDRTVYLFSSGHEGFSPLLERFSRFFIDPLFHPSGIAREMHAVDQEFSKNIENDFWREMMVFKETGNPEHPNAKFSTGNSATLAHIPQRALKEWHEQHYSADRMRLVLYSSQALEVLKQEAVQLFTEIPTSSRISAQENQALTSDRQRGHFTYIKPIHERQLLTLSWELPRALSLDPSYSAQTVAYVLNRAGPHSLYEVLKKEGLVDELIVSVDELGGPAHRFFQIHMELTDRGCSELSTAILRCFQAIRGIAKNSLSSLLFQEMSKIAQINYQFQQRQDPYQLISIIGRTILDEPLETYPRQGLLPSSYDPARIVEVLKLLTPKTCLFVCQANPAKTSVLPDQRERWMGAEYALRDIPSSWLTLWQKAEPHPEIRLPDPNPFIPSRFDLVLEKTKNPLPLCLAEDEAGIAYYIRLEEFQSPEAVIHLRLLSPVIGQEAKSISLTELYLDHLTDRLHPILATAASSGLRASWALEKNRIQLTLAGFSDKAPLLLQEILKQMVSSDHPSKEEFAIYQSRHAKYFANGLKDLPCWQAKELALSLINQEKVTRQEKGSALKEITYQDFLQFHNSLLDRTYIEALFSGNLSVKEAESAWLDIRHLLSSKSFSKKDHPQTKILSLPQKGPFAIREKTTAAGNAALLLLDLGTFTFERRAAQEILSAALRESFFHTLRTEQKTGYIVHTYPEEYELRLFQTFFVQSNSHQPDDLLYRFELFLESSIETLSELIPEERFSMLKRNLSHGLRTGFRNIKDKSALWSQLAFDRSADFAWLEKRLAGFQDLTYASFLEEARSFLSRQNRKRLAVLFEGRLHTPFTYETIHPSKLKEICETFSRFDVLSDRF